MKRLIPILFIILLAFPSTIASGQGITTTSSTIPSNCQNCQSTNATQIVPYSIKVGQFGTDKGLITYATSLQGFTWNVTDGQSLTFGLPSPASTIFFNSTITSIQLSGISFFYKPEGYQTLITIQGTGTGASVCIALQGGAIQDVNPVNGQMLASASLGGISFSWGDIPPSMDPIYQSSQLCYTPPLGPYSIDPLAADDTGGTDCVTCSSISAGITTSVNNDVVIVMAAIDTTSGAQNTVSSVTDGTHTYYNRVVYNTFDIAPSRGCTSAHCDDIEEWYSVWATAGAFSPTVTATASSNIVWINVAAISGAALGNCASGGVTCFDPSVSFPATSQVTASTSNQVTITTTNTNDFLVASNLNFPSGQSVPSGFTGFGTTNSMTNGYEIVSAIQSGVTEKFTWSSASGAGMIFDAVCGASACTVTSVSQGIQISTLPAGSPLASIGISGCAVTNASFTADGFIHKYTLTTSCSVSLANPTPGTHSRYCWNVSPKPHCSTGTITFSTCAGPAACSTYSNSTYYQLAQNWTLTAQSPTTWDGGYFTNIIGTFLGTSSTSTACSLTSAGTTNSHCVNIYFDYNTQSCSSTPIGNTWNAVAPNCFTDTTADNVHTVNYIQSSGGNNSLILIGGLFGIGSVFIISRRRRAGESDGGS